MGPCCSGRCRRRWARPFAGWLRQIAVLALALAGLFIGLPPLGAEVVQVEARREGDVGRVVLAWPAPVGFDTSTANDRLTLRFEQPVEADFWAVRTLRRYVGLPVQSADRRTLTFPLKPGILALAYADGARVVLDFARSEPEPSADAPSRLPAAAAAAAAAESAPAATPTPASTPAPASVPEAPEAAVVVNVRSGQHRSFSRLVFDWDRPVGYAVERGEQSLTLVFDRPARIDVRQFERKYLKYVLGGTAEQQGQSTRVQLQISPGSDVRDTLEGQRVVIDVFAPSPDYAPPAAATPTASPPEPPASASPPTAPATSAAPSSTGTSNAPTAAASPVPVAASADVPAAASPPPTVPPPPMAQPSPPAGENAAPPAPATLRFAWNRPVAAAVFRRGANLWVIFDAPSKQDVMALRRAAGGSIAALEQRPHDRATVLQLRAADDLTPSVRRDGLAWILRLEPGTPPQGEPIAPVVDPQTADGPRLLLPVAEPGLPLAVADPDARDTMVVVPLIPLQSRIAQTISYPQFRLPATAQGIVVEPWIETLRVRSLRDGVELSDEEPLVLSLPSTARRLTSTGVASGGLQAAASSPQPTRVIDPQQWGYCPPADFTARRQALERAVRDASVPGTRERSRLQLAQFLIGQHFATEALGVLALAAAERPDLSADPGFLALRGAAQLLAGRNRPARDDLSRAGGSDETDLWETAAQTALDAEAGAAAGSASEPLPQVLKDRRWTALLASYPPPVRVPLALLLAEAATRAGALREADALIGSVDGEVKSPPERAQVAYLEGLRKQATGDVDGALASFAEAARTDPRRGRAQADLGRVRLLTGAGRMTAAEGAAALDPVRYAWRGDALENDVLRELGRLQLQAEDYPAGLRTLKQAASELPNGPGKAEITQAMARAFEALYLEGAADRLPPVTALSLYEEFKELTPPGEQGDEMIRRLAERLVQMDLLDQAATLLEKQLATMSASANKAELGSRLAEIRLLDNNSEPALDALVRSQSSSLPQPLQRRRALLQARALAKLGQGDEALAVLGQDDGLDAQLLRAQIYRARGDWGQAAAALRRVVDAAKKGDAQPLDEQQARDVLDLAVALSLAGSDPQLASLDDQYGTAMAATPMRDAFRLIAGTVPPPSADAAALGELVEKAMAFRRSLSPATDTPPGARPSTTPGEAIKPSR